MSLGAFRSGADIPDYEGPSLRANSHAAFASSYPSSPGKKNLNVPPGGRESSQALSYAARSEGFDVL